MDITPEPKTVEQNKPNGVLLLAAASDLFFACRAAKNVMEQNKLTSMLTYKVICDAIRKAEGAQKVDLTGAFLDGFFCALGNSAPPNGIRLCNKWPSTEEEVRR